MRALVKPPFPPEDCRGLACDFRSSHDPVTLQPKGTRCGRAATQVIYWAGELFSPACGQHGLPALDPEAIEQVLCVHPIEPAFVVDAGTPPALPQPVEPGGAPENGGDGTFLDERNSGA